MVKFRRRQATSNDNNADFHLRIADLLYHYRDARLLRMKRFCVNQARTSIDTKYNSIILIDIPISTNMWRDN